VHNGILLCRHHHRAKRRDGWWPTLHPDGTVTWTHPDRRTRTDPPPATIDHHITTLTHASTTTTAAGTADAACPANDTATNTADHSGQLGLAYRYTPAGNDTHAGPTATSEIRGTYHTARPARPPPAIVAAAADGSDIPGPAVLERCSASRTTHHS
jgi:hypothetical protein